MEKKDKENAAILYDEVDRNKLFRGTAAVEDRSIMNVCFVMSDEYKELEDEFNKFAAAAGMAVSKDTVQWVVSVPLFTMQCQRAVLKR